MKHNRKSSSRITLVLISAISISSCGDGDPPQQRDVYLNANDCIADWGKPEHCEPVRNPTNTGYYYHGPAYRVGSTSANGAPRQGSRAIASRTISRGGFGSSSRSGGS